MSEDSSEHNSTLITTRDGSHTVYSSLFDQHYHNPNGAIAESKHVFFEQTDLLDALNQKTDITILEVGFGTGLNLMLLLDYYLDSDSETKIYYYTIEGFPLDSNTAQNLNYKQHLNHPELGDNVLSLFDDLDDGMNTFSFFDNVSIYIFNWMFAEFPEENIGAQYIFHDAFSPDANPDLWTGDVFTKLKTLSADDVMLSTYCAASKAQGALAWAGWHVAKTQGALGKREMIVASLDPHNLSDLKRINEERYAHRYEKGDFN